MSKTDFAIFKKTGSFTIKVINQPKKEEKKSKFLAFIGIRIKELGF